MNRARSPRRPVRRGAAAPREVDAMMAMGSIRAARSALTHEIALSLPHSP